MIKAVVIRFIMFFSELIIIMLPFAIARYHIRRIKKPGWPALVCYLFAIALVVVHVNYPLENVLFRYASPEEAYRVKHPFHKPEAIFVNDTNEVAFVFGITKHNELCEVQLENSGRGWKFVSIKNQFTSTAVDGNITGEGFIYNVTVQTNPMKSDWKLVSVDILDINLIEAKALSSTATAEQKLIRKEHAIQDSLNSSFAQIPYPDDYSMPGYIAFVKDMPENYSVTVDGQTLSLSGLRPGRVAPNVYIIFYILWYLAVHLITVKCVKKKSKKQV